jgi:hypothetical protein
MLLYSAAKHNVQPNGNWLHGVPPLIARQTTSDSLRIICDLYPAVGAIKRQGYFFTRSKQVVTTDLYSIIIEAYLKCNSFLPSLLKFTG